MYFKKSPEGLYFTPIEMVQKNGVTLLSTVEANKKGYTKQQIARAELAKRLYEMIEFPSMKDFKTVLQMNGIRNCPITVEDLKICIEIFGPNIAALKGKSVRTKPKVVVKDYIDVPKDLTQES